jgi:deoxyribodipyrimidine photolyase
MNIFLFHRDLRINDNTTLIKMIKEMDEIIPIFIFTNDQILKTNNKKRSTL